MKLAEDPLRSEFKAPARTSRFQEKHLISSWQEMPSFVAPGYMQWRIEAKNVGFAALVVSSFRGQLLTEDPVKQLFEALQQEWKEETEYISSVTEMVLHPAYQQIIGMGKQAIPMLLEELERQPAHWFWALKAIAREDPVPASSRGNVREMAAAWVRWGRERGYMG